MSQTNPESRRLPVAPVLFLALFAAQAPAFALAPMLPRLAGDFSVSVAAVGQLRTISGFVAAATTFGLTTLCRRLSLRDLITAGLGLLALGSLAIAAAVDFAMLVAAHVLIGAGMGVVLTGGTAATAQWIPASDRTRALTWTLAGPPAAAIVATMTAGMFADVDWRVAWLTVPFVAGVVAAIAVRSRPAEAPSLQTQTSMRALWAVPGLPGWAVGELLAYAAWSGIPVYAAALLIQSYDTSPALAAAAIGACAVAFVAGTMLARRRVDVSSRALLLTLSLALSGAAAAFGALRVGLLTSTALLVLLGLLAGGRALAGTTFGLRVTPGSSVAVMGVRTAAQQAGYLCGAGLGGAAIAVNGYDALAALLATLFLLAAVPHALAIRSRTAEATLRHGTGPRTDGAPAAAPAAS